MPKVTIDGKEVEVPRGTAVIRAAAMLGINVPHFCYHPALSSPANCRMCLVEIEGARKLEPACYAKVNDGMVVHTSNEKVDTARRAVLEFILVNHPVDCPICDQAGECKLQDYYMAYDAKPSRLSTEKVGKAKVYPIGPHVVYDGERCILCTRCVRFVDEVTGTSELTTVQRGDHSEIRTFPGRELDNPYSMNVTDICPVGALTTRDFRFKCRVWLLSSTDSVCTGCSKGCNVHLEHHLGKAQRYRPRFNPEVNEYWMCDAGRLSYREIASDRSTQLSLHGDTSLSWPRLARTLADELSEKAGDAARVGFVASAQATTEGLFAGRAYAEKVLGAGRMYWSGKADGDSDELLVRADKNPNRAGVEAVFGDDFLEDDAHRLLEDLEAGKLKVLFMMGAELPFGEGDTKRFVAAVKKLDTFVLQSAHRGVLADVADVLLPAASHAEEFGTFVNEDGIVQPIDAAFEPPGDALPNWAIFRRLALGAKTRLGFDDLDAIQRELFSELEEAAE